MAVATAIGWAVGTWLDGQFGTEPWLMIAFFILGVAAGFKGVIRAARQASRSSSESSGRDGESKS